MMRIGIAKLLVREPTGILLNDWTDQPDGKSDHGKHDEQVTIDELGWLIADGDLKANEEKNEEEFNAKYLPVSLCEELARDNLLPRHSAVKEQKCARGDEDHEARAANSTDLISYPTKESLAGRILKKHRADPNSGGYYMNIDSQEIRYFHCNMLRTWPSM